MTDQSIKDLKDAVFCQEGPSPELIIDLAPFLTEPLLSRAISVANVVTDPYQRALILLALAGSDHISDDRRKALVKAALNAANKISSRHEKIQVLEKILPLAYGKDLRLVEALLEQEQEQEAFEPCDSSEKEICELSHRQSLEEPRNNGMAIQRHPGR